MLHYKFISSITISLLFLLITISSKAQTPTYEMYITNQLQVDSKTYQFDVYVLNIGTPILELANIQLGIGFDTSITNGGTLSVALVSGSSQLVSAQVPTNIAVGGAYFTVNGVVYRSINQSHRTGPGAGNGTIISKIKTSCTSPGTRIGTYRLTNTKYFTISSLTKHIFNITAGTQRVSTAVSCYVNGSNTPAIGTLYNYNNNGTCDQNLMLNECSISTSVSTTPVIYYGETTGTATVTISGAGTSSTGTFKLDGGSPIEFTTNPFVVNGLSAGNHNVTLTSGLCEASTGSFTIVGPALDPNLQRPPKPSAIKVTPLYVSECNTKVYRFEVEEDLPPSTPTRIFANGWKWQFGSVFYQSNNSVIFGIGTLEYYNAIIDSGSINSKKIVVKITNNRNPVPWDSVMVCYTSIIGDGRYQKTRDFNYTFKKIPVPTHIAVKALDASPEGYRRFRYSAPDSIPVVTDTTVQPTGWQWSFVGNLSQNMIIDSGNYNSKQIVVKLISNEAETAEDSVKLAYLSSCGTGKFTATKFTRTSGHKYIFDNNYLDEATGDYEYDFYWENLNNWEEYPSNNLVFGDTVIIKGGCILNIPVIFDYGTVLIVDQGFSDLTLRNILTSNCKIINNSSISSNELGNLCGNYFMENYGFFQPQNPSFNQPGTIINNGYLGMDIAFNIGHIINNE